MKCGIIGGTMKCGIFARTMKCGMIAPTMKCGIIGPRINCGNIVQMQLLLVIILDNSLDEITVSFVST